MRMAHTLKGVAGNIGAKGIQKAAGALEQACKTGADQEQLETLLSMVETALAPVLESLKQIQPEQEQTQASPQAVNPEELTLLYQKLIGLLQEDDADAMEVLEEIVSLIGDRVIIQTPLL